MSGLVFGIVPVEVARDTRLDRSDLAVLMLLFSLKVPASDPSVGLMIAGRLNMLVEDAGNILEELAVYGWIDNETGLVKIPDELVSK